VNIRDILDVGVHGDGGAHVSREVGSRDSQVEEQQPSQVVDSMDSQEGEEEHLASQVVEHRAFQHEAAIQEVLNWQLREEEVDHD